MLRPPLGCSSPASAGGIPSWSGTPPAPPYSYIGCTRQPRAPPPSPPANPRAQGRRAGIARATSCHRPSSPHRCAWRGLGSRGRGPRSEALPPLCVPKPAVPGLRAARSRSPAPRPEAATSRSPERARPPARTRLWALTVAPRLLLQVGARQGGWRPRRPGARRLAERSHDPQVASHAEQRTPTPQARPERRPLLRCLAAGCPDPGLPARGHGRGRGRRGRRPIGPRREGAGPAGGTRPLTQPALPQRRGKPSWTRARGG